MKILIGEEAITEVSPCSGETDLFFFAEIWSSEVADVSFLQRNAFCKLPLPASPFHLCFATGGPHRSWVSYKENYKQFHPAYLVIYWEDLCSELCCCGPGNGSHGWLLSDDQSVARIVNERRGERRDFFFLFFRGGGVLWGNARRTVKRNSQKKDKDAHSGTKWDWEK